MILKGPLTKTILALSIPIMMGNLIQTLYNLTDSFFVSKLGTFQMAAMQVTFPLIFFMISIASGLSVGGIALISQYIGANRKENARNIAGQLMTVSLIGGLILGVIGYSITENLLELMNASGELLEHANAYLKIMFLGIPTLFISFSFTAIKQGEGDTVTPMIVSSMSVILNVILDPIFIFVFDLGIEGAAYATVLSRAIFNVVAVYILFSEKHNTLKIRKKDLNINFNYIKEIMEIGMPSGIGQSTTAVGFAVMNSFIIMYGEQVVTAFAIGNRISSLVFMPAMGIGAALATIVGQNMGAGQIKRANEAFLKSALLSSLIMLVSASIMFMFTDNLVAIFTKDSYIIKEGSFYLKMILVTIPLFGFFMSLTGLFQGSGHTISAMILGIGRLWLLRIPMILLLQYFNLTEPKYIWYAMILSNLIVVMAGLAMYLSGKWKNTVIKEKQELEAI